MSNSCWWPERITSQAARKNWQTGECVGGRQSCSPATTRWLNYKIESKLLSQSRCVQCTTPFYWHANAGSASWTAWIKWTPSPKVLQRPRLWQPASRVVKNSLMASGSNFSRVLCYTATEELYVISWCAFTPAAIAFKKYLRQHLFFLCSSWNLFFYFFIKPHT